MRRVLPVMTYMRGGGGGAGGRGGAKGVLFVLVFCIYFLPHDYKYKKMPKQNVGRIGEEAQRKL